MEIAWLIVGLSAAFAAGLTLFSGFGLGTLLLPVFALFFPIEVAVATTAVVHGANNVFKVSLMGRHADREIVWRFGLPALLAAVAGAALLGVIAAQDPLLEYEVLGFRAEVRAVKLAIGILMLAFAWLELSPRLSGFQFKGKHYFLGGVISGFFGGLSGHQGALRSAFLAKSGLDTAGFVGTSSTIGLMVDVARVATYGVLVVLVGESLRIPDSAWSLIAVGCLSAFAGVLAGKRYLHKVRIRQVQVLTGSMLMAIALLLIAGWL